MPIINPDTSWMTKTGGILVAVGGTLSGADAAGIDPPWGPLLAMAGKMMASAGVALIGNGIRRRMPAPAKRGRPSRKKTGPGSQKKEVPSVE